MYVIGIDFGSGETTAASLNLDNGMIEDLNILEGNVKKIKSSMVQSPEGAWMLDPSFESIKYVLESQNPNFYAYFKGPIVDGKDNGLSAISEDQRAVFGRFVKEVYDHIISSNDNLLPQKIDGEGNLIEANFRVYVACPSGWDQGQVDAYRNFLLENGVPCEDVVKESRAAYISARDGILRDLRVNSSQGVLVIDYGSSTIDLTWFGNPEKEAVTEGFQLGALNVESVLFDYLSKNVEKAATAYESSRQYIHNEFILRALIKYSLRVNKEKYYDDLNKQGGNNVRFHDVACSSFLPTDDDIELDPKFRFGFPREQQSVIRPVLCEYISSNPQCDGKSYSNAILAELKNFIVRHPEVADAETVILTGGASVMDFFQDVVKEAFPAAEIKTDGQASYSISRGIAKYGCKKFHSDPILLQVEEILQHTWMNDDWVTQYLDKTIIETTRAVYRDKLNGVLDDWVNGVICDDPNHSLQIYFDRLQQKIDAGDVNGIPGAIMTNNVFIKDAEPMVFGRHSIHGLMTALFDYVDKSNLQQEISETINKVIQDSIENIADADGGLNLYNLLQKYIDVYFGEDANVKPMPFLISTQIAVPIDSDKKFNLFLELLSNNISSVQSYDSWGVTYSTLHKDRESGDGLFSPGRPVIGKVFRDVVDLFSSSIAAVFDIDDSVRQAKSRIEKMYYDTRRRCELMTYSL